MYKAILLDLSGVLYQGDQLIAGAVEAVEQLRRAGVTLRFVTNTSRQPAAVVLDKLRRLGFALDEAELFTAPHAARRWLRAGGYRPHLLVHPEIRCEFDDLDRHEPNAVLLADAEDELNYRNLDEAFAVLMEGAPLVAIGNNRYFRDSDRLHLDVGPFVRALEYAADIEAHIAGKPAPLFFEQVVADAGCSPEEVLMVGDDVQADVQGALDAGLNGCLVRTGKYRDGDEERLSGDAMVEDSIVSLVERLEGRGARLEE
jgi:HAD superfamily hydrolase (TIGR01458 family)